MKRKAAEFPADMKVDLLNRIRRCLERRRDLVFAYVHGSFLTSGPSSDIDIAIFLGEIPDSPLQAELELEQELGSAAGGMPVDVRILNGSPLSFRYNVIRYGQTLLVNDDDIRTDFVTATLTNYFDFAPFRRMYLKETLGVAI